MNPAAPYSSSPCRERNGSSRSLLRWPCRAESRANTSCEIVLLHRLTQVTQDPILQGASPVSIIGKGGHEDCRYRVARLDKVPVEFEPGHSRHMDVRDQAGCFGKPRGREKIGCRRENGDRIAQRSHEPG